MDTLMNIIPILILVAVLMVLVGVSFYSRSENRVLHAALTAIIGMIGVVIVSVALTTENGEHTVTFYDHDETVVLVVYVGDGDTLTEEDYPDHPDSIPEATPDGWDMGPPLEDIRGDTDIYAQYSFPE